MFKYFLNLDDLNLTPISYLIPIPTVFNLYFNLEQMHCSIATSINTDQYFTDQIFYNTNDFHTLNDRDMKFQMQVLEVTKVILV